MTSGGAVSAVNFEAAIFSFANSSRWLFIFLFASSISFLLLVSSFFNSASSQFQINMKRIGLSLYKNETFRFSILPPIWSQLPILGRYGTHLSSWANLKVIFIFKLISLAFSTFGSVFLPQTILRHGYLAFTRQRYQPAVG